jgi:hypothetical protein
MAAPLRSASQASTVPSIQFRTKDRAAAIKLRGEVGTPIHSRRQTKRSKAKKIARPKRFELLTSRCVVCGSSSVWGYRRSEIASNSIGSRCLKIRASDALDQAALVYRFGEQRRIRERGGQLSLSRGPEIIAKITRPPAPNEPHRANRENDVPWRSGRERNWDPTCSAQASVIPRTRANTVRPPAWFPARWSQRVQSAWQQLIPSRLRLYWYAYWRPTN